MLPLIDLCYSWITQQQEKDLHSVGLRFCYFLPWQTLHKVNEKEVISTWKLVIFKLEDFILMNNYWEDRSMEVILEFHLVP